MKKKRMFLYILLALVGVVGVFLIIVALRPAEYRVTRSTTVAAPAAVVFEQVNDLHKWEGWNPWGKIDPNMKLTYDGPPAGKGASYSWTGNREVGRGIMTITDSKPPEQILFKLEFFEPMPGVSDTEFTFKGDNNQTTVTWTMSGKNNFIGKAFCLFMNMDNMIGGQFEKGLADLKKIAEEAAKK